MTETVDTGRSFEGRDISVAASGMVDADSGTIGADSGIIGADAGVVAATASSPFDDTLDGSPNTGTISYKGGSSNGVSRQPGGGREGGLE